MSTSIAELRTAIRQRARTTDSITRGAIGLVALAVVAAVVHSRVAPRVETTGGELSVIGSASLEMTGRVTGFGVAEPSGVALDPQSGSLFVVGDEGSIAELGPDHAAIRTQPASPGAEDIAIHTPTGLLVAVSEETAELVVLSPGTLSELRRFPLDRPALLAVDPTGDINQGFEGLAFSADPSQPGGGTFYLTHQRDPAMVISLTFDPSVAPHLIGADAVTARWTVPGAEELNGVTYDVGGDRLLAIDDARDALIVLGLDGRLLGGLALPGIQQEGVVMDSNGTLWIADDADGALLAFQGADATIDGVVTPVS